MVKDLPRDLITPEDVTAGSPELGGHDRFRAHTLGVAMLEKGAQPLFLGYRLVGHEYSTPDG